MRPPQSARGNVHRQVSVLRYKRPKTMRYWLHDSNNRHWMLYYLMEFLWSYWWSLPRTLKLWPVEIYQWFGKSIYIKALRTSCTPLHQLIACVSRFGDIVHCILSRRANSELITDVIPKVVYLNSLQSSVKRTRTTSRPDFNHFITVIRGCKYGGFTSKLIGI